MTVTALSATSTDLKVGAEWVVTVQVCDVDGNAADVTPVVTVTLPGGATATPTPDQIQLGLYRVVYEVATAGRYTARVVAAGYGVATFAAYVEGVTAAADMPDVDSFKVYAKLPEDDDSIDVEIGEALAAESAAQRRICRVPAEFPADLREALHRRIARNLAMRGIPLAVLRGDAESGNTVLPGRDPEVRRLELPHLKLVMG